MVIQHKIRGINMKNKLKILMIVAAISTTMFPTYTFADVQETTEAELDETNKKDVQIPIEYTVDAAFTVKLPSVITLTDTDGNWNYSGTVGVKGDIDSGKVIQVTPAEYITMYDVTNRTTSDIPSNTDDQSYEHKDAKNVTVEQNKQLWSTTEINADDYSDTDLALTAGKMQSGKWRGTLPVNIKYDDELCLNGTHHYQELITKEATCAEDGEKTLTCSVCGDTKTENIAGGHLDMDSDGLCDRCGENPYILGDTYTLGNRDWMVVENKEGYTVLQSIGVDRSLWPGYLSSSFGNRHNYSSNIDGKDISNCRSSLTALYDKIESVEYSEAEYGTGLYLISSDMAQSSYANGYYNKALKAAANNTKFGSGGYYAWLGTVYMSSQAWTVDYDGEVHANGSQRNDNLIIAPAFNLDPTKVILEDKAITIK